MRKLRMKQNNYGCQENCTAHQRARQKIIEIILELILLHVPEVGSLKTKYEKRIEEGDKGIYQAHFPIFDRSPEFIGQVGREHVKKEPCKNGTCTIPKGLSG